MLLLWSPALKPAGESSLAAIRFGAAVQLRSIRIVPDGVAPFAQMPDEVGQTLPHSFDLDLYINAQPLPTVSEPKPKATNVLIPLSLRYSGQLADFKLDVPQDISSRLLIVKGSFNTLSIAVYGEYAPQTPTDAAGPPSYSPKLIQVIEHQPLSSVLDIASTQNPASLARQVLASWPGAPSLSEITRRLSCYRAVGSSVAEPDVLQADLERCLNSESEGGEWLEQAVATLRLPVSEATPEELLSQFFGKFRSCLSDTLEEDQTSFLLEILHSSAWQPVCVAQSFLETCDFTELFEKSPLDENFLLRLRDTCASPHIAQYFGSSERIVEALSQTRDNTRAREEVQKLAGDVLIRIHGWDTISRLLSGDDADLDAAIRWLKGLTDDESAFGLFMSNLFSTALPQPPSKPQPHLPELNLGFPCTRPGRASKEDFFTFLRVYIGVAALGLVFAWAVEDQAEPVYARILPIFQIWQSEGGYREIINHIIPSHPMFSSFATLLDLRSNPKLVVNVESVLSCLLEQPSVVRRKFIPDLIELYGSSLMSRVDAASTEEILTLARGGLEDALRTIFNTQIPDAFGSRSLYPYHLALIMVEHSCATSEDGTASVIGTILRSGRHGFIYHLLDALVHTTELLRTHIATPDQASISPSTFSRVMSISATSLRVIEYFLPMQPLPSRTVIELTRAMILAFGLAESTGRLQIYESPSAALRDGCVSVMRALVVSPGVLSLTSRALETLLTHVFTEELDEPVSALKTIENFLDLILPLPADEDSAVWTKQIILLTAELPRFLLALDIDDRLHLAKRLIEIDRDDLGMAAWIVRECIKSAEAAFHRYVNAAHSMEDRAARAELALFHISSTFDFLYRLTDGNMNLTTEIIEDAPTADALERVFKLLFEHEVIIISVVDFARHIASSSSGLPRPELESALILTMMRTLRAQSSPYPPFALLSDSWGVLQKSSGAFGFADIEQMFLELGLVLSHIVGDEQIVVECAAVLVSMLEWFGQRSNRLVGLSDTTFEKFHERAVAVLEPAQTDTLNHLRYQLRFSDSPPAHPIMVQNIQETVSTTIQSLQEGFARTPSIPSTPPRRPGALHPDVIEMTSLSPLTLFRSPANVVPSMSRTYKTYSKNDFRQLRTSPLANTSRPPSMHVDDYELGASPTRVPMQLPQSGLGSPLMFSHGLPPPQQ
ncbi:hypothetical protein BOTBODRAFT_37524 [Botryobasidium botryosum FD-172 SS1]|uniref:Virilizer N-terminal domain-containing protein n=1 Tax=Botryobasidium botryosum (strain FD-172 SS1) TaxID=930990 RepID=A0A067MB89_BOTB1|nr:hypothetical protein BOTBODRAFT_37524 [Botryobasidium botryosum FD-172 SS1]